MGRLTERVFAFNEISCMQIKACGNDMRGDTCRKQDGKAGCKGCPINIAIEKLAEYEGLEERGCLPGLPLGVWLGDTVYSPILDPLGEPRKYIAESEVEDISLKGITFAGAFVPWEGFGRMDFLTREEAERALQGMGEEG